MILADNNEPAELIKLIQQAVPVVVSPLNQMHISDYFFGNYEGKRLQFSRKQAGELLGNIDEAEDQLRDYYEQADENCQIVEGVISGTPLATLTDKQIYAIKSGKVAWHEIRYEPKVREPSTNLPTTRGHPPKLGSYSYKVESITDRTGVTVGILTNGRAFDTPISLVYVWIHRLTKVGIVTYWTANWTETARLLMTIYHNEQKPPEEHSTLQRVIRPRIQVKEPEPFLKALMFLSNAYKLQIGETKGQALANKFCNILDLATSSVSDIMEVEGMGKKLAERLLTALGRGI